VVARPAYVPLVTARPATAVEPAALARAAFGLPAPPAPEPFTTLQRGEPFAHESGTAVPDRIEAAANDRPTLTVVTLQPAVLAPSAAPSAQAALAPERTVHVRIGAIEIYQARAEPGPPAPAALAPSPVATFSAPASAARGFDDYAALRSYAPWAW
jgi:hypothetical protein